MNSFLQGVLRVSRGGNAVAGVTLVLIMAITVADVFLRSLGKPIVGIYELVAFLGAVVIGFAFPYTSWTRGHIYVDALVVKLPPRGRAAVHVTTRLMGLCIFVLIAWNLFRMGSDLVRSGEVSPTLQVPFYPIVYGIGVACGIQALVLFCDLVKIARGQYE